MNTTQKQFCKTHNLTEDQFFGREKIDGQKIYFKPKDIMITDGQIEDACNKAYLKAGHNAYFGNGFEAGVRFALEQVKNLSTHNETNQRVHDLEKALRTVYSQCKDGGHLESNWPGWEGIKINLPGVIDG